MLAIYEQLRNPLTTERDIRDGSRIAEAFPSLQSGRVQHVLTLRRYVNSCPERFLNSTAYESFLTWLRRRGDSDGEALKVYLSRFDAEINRAVLFLREINGEEWHDRPLDAVDEYDLLRFIDKRVHPTYLRLIEAVLAPMTKVVAHFSRIDRGKGTEGLDVWAVMNELEAGETASLVGSYRNIVRNGIAHGGITFLENEVRYRDKKGKEETLSTAAIVRLCDDLLDTCNGLAAALKVFYLGSRERGYVPPRELLVEELQDATWAPWWTIEGCVESENAAGKAQLIVYARPNSRHYAKVYWSAIQSGIFAEFFAPGYDRYFLSLRSPKALPGWAGFDGAKLRSLRESGTDDLSRYKGIVENDCVFYVAKPAMPALVGTLDTYARSFRMAVPIAMQEFRERLGIPLIVCRNATVHRNSWGSVLNAEVVLAGLDDEEIASVIRKQLHRIVRSGVRRARKLGFGGVATYLPLGFARVAVFRRDYRRRRLSGFGLGRDLVCTVQLQRIGRIKSPDIRGSTIENVGKWRIAWNKAWLKTNGRNVSPSVVTLE